MFLALRRIHVFASDFSRSRRFYGETLGLPEASGFENDWVEFALGPILLKLTPLRPGEVPARNQVAAVFSTAGLDDAIGRLKERGVTVTRPPSEEFTGRSAEILDPDGYRIILFQASDLHPDEEWVPSSGVDDLVKQKLHARKKRELARGTGKKPARKAARPAKKAAPKKNAKKKAPKKKAGRRR
jgi:predicted enzyme related to lactoylglutathione lyase